ncbi:hypothetical protein C8R47DRAFT_1160496 [Mycena vitilis]|nr:hypothetical protein C8R47DRAFT_1160496 [Mycena vitilis]
MSTLLAKTQPVLTRRMLSAVWFSIATAQTICNRVRQGLIFPGFIITRIRKLASSSVLHEKAVPGGLNPSRQFQIRYFGRPQA